MNDDDKDTTTQAAAEPPRALADGDSVEVDLAAFGLDAPEAASTETTETRTPETAPAETRPELRPREERGERERRTQRVPVRELHREREKTKRAQEDAERWRRLAEQAQRGDASIEPGIRLNWSAVGLTPQEKQELIREASQANDFGPPVEKIISAFERLLVESNKRAAQQASVQLDRHFRQREYLRQERDFVRDGHEDFQDVIRRSGIADLVHVDPVTLVRGPKFNPAIADEITRAENQAEVIYGIAKNMLGEADKRPDGFRSEPDPEVDPPSPSRYERTPANPPAEASPTAAEVEAERRGAREVAARVATNGAQPQRSVRTFTPAGSPKNVQLNEDYRKYLDTQWDKNPQGVMDLFDKHPGVRDWYEGQR